MSTEVRELANRCATVGTGPKTMESFYMFVNLFLFSLTLLNGNDARSGPGCLKAS